MSKEKTILQQIRVALGVDSEIKLEELKTSDDVTLFAEKFEQGEAIYILQEDERIALPVGEYSLADGRIVVVAEEGVIAELKAETMEEEAETVSEEELAEIEKAAAELKAENEKLKAELNKPAAKAIKRTPSPATPQVYDKVELSTMSPKDRVNYRLFGNTPQSIPMKFRENNIYKRINLATSVTSAYGGEFAGLYVAAALLSGDTLANDAITIKPNVAYQSAIKKAVIAGIITDASCDFTDAGDVTLTDVMLTPKKLQVNSVLCKADFEADYEAVAMGYSAFKNMPPTFQAFLVQYIGEAIANDVETSIWQGVASNDGEFDGFTTLMAVDTDIVDVTSTAITAANVIEEMAKVTAACPVAVRNKPDATLYVSSTVYYAYVDALGGFGADGLGANGVAGQGTMWYTGQQLTFSGTKVFHAPGMPAGQMVMGQKSNLFFGTGLMSDLNMVKIIDTADILGDENVRYISRFTGAVNYVIGSDIVYYWTNA